MIDVEVVRADIDRAVAGRTVPSMFLRTVAALGDRTAVRWRDGPAWSELTYEALAARVARAAGRLRGLGVGAGDRVVLMITNRPEFYVADLASLFLGATPISIYGSSSPEQIAYQAHHAGAAVAVVDPAHVDAVAAARSGAPALRRIVVTQDLDAAPIELSERAARPDDLATVIYTSGTTGPPKGVTLSHRTVSWTVECYARTLEVDPVGLRVISYLPMAHIAARITTYYQAVTRGYEVTTCPDMADIASYIRDTRPHVLFGVPRMWQKLRSSLRAELGAGGGLDDAVVTARPLRRAEDAGTITEKERGVLSGLDAQWLRAARERVGLDECRYAVIGAAPSAVELLQWYRGLGVPMSEIYGLSESCGPLTWDTAATRPGTVGQAMPGITVRLAADGEVVAQGGNIFQGYLNDPERTAEAIDSDGWLHTGDIGVWEDGHLRIIDRKKELLITAGGKNVSPSNLEGALTTVPLVAQACVVGDGRPYIAALVTLDPDAVAAWASARGRSTGAVHELATDPTLVAEVEAAAAAVMTRFSRPERVKRIKILPQEWLPDSDELTPTSKLKRRIIHAKYATAIEELYG